VRRAILIALLGAAPALATAEDSDLPEASSVFDGREYLVPELATDPLHVDEGTRPYQSRLSFSPGYGRLGSEKLYALRLAYNPNAWLGWEVAFGHNPGESVHALLHTLSALVRYPLPWRFQPYGSLGYGMIMVYPGESLNSDPVTKNALTAGGGLEVYVRDDVALRFEARSVTVLGGTDENGDAASWRYAEKTVALAFYRGLGQ
jgi:opacity protein-like surface antigen